MPTAKPLVVRMKTDFVRINTERLILRRLEAGDALAISVYRSKPEVARYQSWSSYDLKQAQSLVRQMRKRHPGQEGWFQFAIELKPKRDAARSEPGRLIGDCALKTTASESLGEIGFTLDPGHQGEGLATEAVTALVGYAFSKLKLRRLVATTDALNAPAARLLERVGFRREAHFVENLFFKGELGSEFGYALLASEWKNQRKTPAR